MALDRTQLIALAKATAKASLNPSVAFAFGDKKLTYEALNDTFRKEMNELADTYAHYRENKNLIFNLIEVGLDEVLPAKVLQNYGQFADVKTYAQGDRPVFRMDSLRMLKRTHREINQYLELESVKLLSREQNSSLLEQVLLVDMKSSNLMDLLWKFQHLHTAELLRLDLRSSQMDILL